MGNSGTDEYLDRDMFAVTLGAGVNEVDLRLSWPDGDVDMDMLVFDSLEAPLKPRGVMGPSTDDDEHITARGTPGGEMWIWVGAWDNTPEGGQDLPLTYDVSICPGSFTP